MSQVASHADQKFADLDREIDAMRIELNAYRLENMRLSHRTFEAEEKLSLQAIRNKKFNFMLEGLPEAQNQDQDEDILTTVTDKINEGSKVKLSKDDFSAASRIGMYDSKAKRPRSISLVAKNEAAWNLLLRSRGKFAKEKIWINEDLPASYRRRKSMLRDLVKLAKTRKHRAKIDQGGISIDGKTYGPELFSQLPEGLRPHDVSTRFTVNKGLAFSSQWTPLSNMATAYFLYEGTLFNSSEQCFQYTKATFENEEDLANDILILSDAYECKKKGAEVDTSEDWMAKRDELMLDIIREKFTQNDDMLTTLLNTGPATLYEATTDRYWGMGSALSSKDTYQETSKGQNKFGLTLMELRKELGGEDLLPSSPNSPGQAPLPATPHSTPHAGQDTSTNTPSSVVSTESTSL